MANQYPQKILIASTNAKKSKEMTQILEASGMPLEVVTLADFNGLAQVEETGDTFLDNARIKAAAGLAVSGLVTIADDGGLEIDALGGLPGVKSHRFLGEDTSFADKMRYILETMRDVPDEKRMCRFRCCVVIASPDGQSFSCEGRCEGVIGTEMSGGYGFGYDPIFYIPTLSRYMAELTPDEKHRISHRGQAMACAIEALRSILNQKFKSHSGCSRNAGPTRS